MDLTQHSRIQQYHLIYFSAPLSVWKRMQRESYKVNTGRYLKGIWGYTASNAYMVFFILTASFNFQIRRKLNVISIAALSVLSRDLYFNSLIFATSLILPGFAVKNFLFGGVTRFWLFLFVFFFCPATWLYNKRYLIQ